MRQMMVAAAFAAIFVSSSARADDIMASRYGNTTIATDAKGMQTNLYYQADGTLTAKQGGKNYTGTWTVAKGRLCLDFKSAPPSDMTNPFCVNAVAHKVGDSWQSNGRTVTLVKGIQ